LKVSNTVPYVHREAYVKKTKSVIREFNKLPNRKHLSSYRVAFGNALEFIHLFEYKTLADWEATEGKDLCDQVKTHYHHEGANLVTASNYEWLRPFHIL
jgi:hypothetical protein